MGQAQGVTDLGTFTYRSKTFENGRKIAQVSGSLSLLNIDGTLIYTLVDRNTTFVAYVYPDGRYRIKIINKKTRRGDGRTGTWRYQNPYRIVTAAKNHRGNFLYRDRFGFPSGPSGYARFMLTINLRKGVHQEIYATQR